MAPKVTRSPSPPRLFRTGSSPGHRRESADDGDAAMSASPLTSAHHGPDTCAPAVTPDTWTELGEDAHVASLSPLFYANKPAAQNGRPSQTAPGRTYGPFSGLSCCSAPASIGNYLAGLKTLHILFGYATDAFLTTDITLLKRGLQRRMGHTPRQVAPFTPERAGLNPHLYSLHSGRRGGATFAFRAGVPVELIRLQGDWRSNAYLLYLKVPLRTRLELCTRMIRRIRPSPLTSAHHGPDTCAPAVTPDTWTELGEDAHVASLSPLFSTHHHPLLLPRF
ncbi:hypothetical protein Bbelb_194370 [Branchiostoma belcheri]|nr:hypothetical protein Bbelb_194370 [Branchiostoma belcheri]